MTQRVQVFHKACCSSLAQVLCGLPPGSAWKELGADEPSFKGMLGGECLELTNRAARGPDCGAGGSWQAQVAPQLRPNASGRAADGPGCWERHGACLVQGPHGLSLVHLAVSLASLHIG